MSHKCLINVTIVISFPPLISWKATRILNTIEMSQICSLILFDMCIKNIITCHIIGDFWPKFLFILCKVHQDQERHWKISIILPADFKKKVGNINFMEPILSYVYLIWRCQVRLVVEDAHCALHRMNTLACPSHPPYPPSPWDPLHRFSLIGLDPVHTNNCKTYPPTHTPPEVSAF